MRPGTEENKVIFVAGDMEVNVAVDNIVLAEDLVIYLICQSLMKLSSENIHDLCKE